MSTGKLSELQEKAMKIRMAILLSIKARGAASQFDLDILELLEDRDRLRERCETYKQLVNSDTVIEVSGEDPDRFVHQVMQDLIDRNKDA
jgi:hypothetical protein